MEGGREGGRERGREIGVKTDLNSHTSSASSCAYSMSSSCSVSMCSDVNAIGTRRRFFFPFFERAFITSSVCGLSHGRGPTWREEGEEEERE